MTDSFDFNVRALIRAEVDQNAFRIFLDNNKRELAHINAGFLRVIAEYLDIEVPYYSNHRLGLLVLVLNDIATAYKE